MDERELFAKTMRGYDGSDAEKERIWKILKEARVSGEYERAAYIIAETQAAAPHTTTAIQNAIGEQIHKKANDIWSKATAAWETDPNFGGRSRPSPAEFFARNREAREQLYLQPIDLSFQRWGDDGHGRILGKQFPEVFNRVTNVAQGMDYLAATQAGSVWQQVTKPYRDADGKLMFRSGDLDRIMEEYNVGMTAGYESLFGFNSMGGKSSVAVHFSANSYNAIRADRKREMEYKAFSGGSAAFTYEEPGDFGYATNGETGEILGDTGMSVAEAGAITRGDRGISYNDAGGWQNPEVMPEGGVEAWQGWMLNQQNDPELDDTFADFDAQANKYSQGYSLIDGGYMRGNQAGTSRLTNIDPTSRFAQAGGMEGDQWRGMRKILTNKQLALYMAAVENGMSIDFNVQRIQNGELVDVPISIPGGQIFGGRTVDQMRQPNWVENLAGQIENVPAYLYTTEERFASGMYKENGRWSVAPLSRTPSEAYNVPVQFQPGSVKAFGEIYETMDPVWDDWSKAYTDATRKARDKIIDEGRAYMQKGKYPEGWTYDKALTRQINLNLPADVPKIGSPEYANYQNASLMLSELSDISGMFNGSTAQEPEVSTIDLWDQITSSQERQTNPDAYSGKIGLGKSQNVLQTKWAQREVESGPAFLAQERAALYERSVERLTSPVRNAEPGGAPNPYQFLTARRGESGPIFPSPDNAYIGPGGTFAAENFYPVGYGAPSLTNKSFRNNNPYDMWFGPAGTKFITNPDWANLPAVDDKSQMVLSAYSARSNRNFIEALPLGSMREDDWIYDLRTNQVPIDPKTGKPVPGMMPFPNYKSAKNIQVSPRRERRAPTENTYDNSILGGNVDTPEMNEFLAQETPNDVNAYPVPKDFDSLAAVGVEGANVVVMDPMIQLRMQADAVEKYRKSQEMVTDNEEFLEADISEKEVLSLIPDPESATTGTVNRIAGIGMRRGYYHTPWRTVSQELNADNPDADWTYEALDKLDPKGRADKLEEYLGTFKRLGRKDLVMKTKLGEMPADYRDFERASASGRKTSYRSTLRMVSDEHKLNLALEPGREGELYDQLAALAAEALNDPQKKLALEAVQGQFAEPGEQYRTMLQYSTQIPVKPGAGPTVQKRMTGPEAHREGARIRAEEAERQARAAEQRAQSHANKAPGGRSMAKWSDADQFEMRRGNMPGMGMNPETGEMNLDSVMTPPAARYMRAANPGGAGGPPNEPPEMPPDFAGEPPEEEPENTPQPQRPVNGRLDELQSKIHYTSLNDARAKSQVSWFLNQKEEENRKRFDVITNEKISKGFLGGLQGMFAGEFDAAGYQFGNLEQVDDPSLPAGYTRWGGRVTEANGNGNGASSAGSSRPQAAPTPQPARPDPDRDPANFPMSPGGEGWKMTFSRYDPRTGHGAQVSAWGRKNDAGDLGWYVRNEAGEMEPLQINKGWGKIYDDKGTLLNDVSRDARDYYDNMNAPIASSAGNSGGAPRTIIEDPAQFPEAGPGRMIKFRPQGGGEMYMHSAQDPTTNEWRWAARSEAGGGNELVFRSSPGYGQVTEDGKVIADVPRAEYERHMASQATVLPTERPVVRPEPAPPVPAATTRIAQQSQAFTRFNLALNDANAVFSGRLYATENGNRYGINPDDTEGFRRGIANEFYGKVAASWNQFVGNPAGSVDNVVDALAGNLGVDEELVKPAAQLLFEEQQRLDRHGHQTLQREGPLRAGTPRRVTQSLTAEQAEAATGRGAPGWRSLAQDRVSTLNQDAALADFTSPSLGVATYTTFEDSNGVARTTRNIARPMGDSGFAETVSPENVQKAWNMAQKAYTDATSGALPQGDPDAVFATIKERMYASLQKQMLEEIDRGKASGLTATDANAHAQVVREVAEHITKKAGEEVKKSLGETIGEVSGAANERHDARVMSREDAIKKLDESPRMRQALGSRSLQEVMDSPDETILLDENNRQFSMGGPSGARYAGGTAYGQGKEHINGLRGAMGKFGSTMYGLYMLKREWQMAGAPVMDEAMKYGQGLAAYAPLIGDGESLVQSDAGFQMRQELGQEFMGKAAYSQYGAFMDIPYRLAESGNMGAARLMETAGVSSGLAFGASMTGQMMKMWGMDGAGAAVAKGGAMLATGMMGASLGMEIYNAIPDGNWFKPEGAPSDWTFSKIVDSVGRLGGIQEAMNKRADAELGKDYVDYVSKERAAGREPMWQSEYDQKRAEMTNLWGGDQGAAVPYMDPKLVQSFLNDADNAKIAELQTSLNGIRQGHGEEGTSLMKAALMQKQAFGATDLSKLDKVSAASVALGLTSDTNLNEGMSYAASMGYLEGSDEFEAATYEFAELTDRKERGRRKYAQGRWNQYGSQIQQFFGADADSAGAGTRLAKQYGLDNQARMGVVTSGLSMVSQFYGKPTEADAVFFGGMSGNANPYVGGAVNQAMQLGAMAGLSKDDVYAMGGALSSAGMSNQDAFMLEKALGGDLMGTMSYDAWHNGGDPNNRWFDQAGRQIIQSNGAATMGVWNKWAPQFGLQTFGGSMSQQIGGFLGTSNASIINAFQQDGMFGLQRLSAEASYNAQMASAGIALKGIALSENFYWGANQGGTWDNPASHSAWGIEDRQVALQRQSQEANFADQWQRMTLSNDFAVRRENNQWERMNVSQDYQRFQFGQQYQSFQQQMSWAREDWDYQDTTRNLQFGWQMEDLNEEIRFASGRQRKQLVKQRDRSTLMHNLEEDQVDTQRSRQETIWKQQEEQFAKQKQYMDELAKLDQESFQINKQQREQFYKMDVDAYNRRLKEYEEQKKLEDELRELQRKHQYDQLQLQKESAAVQAGAAATQKAINDAMIEGQKHWEEITGRFQQMNNYNMAWRLLTAMESLAKTADTVSTFRIQKIIDLLNTIATVAPNGSVRVGGERE